MPRPFLIDTDAGSDDAVAILMAFRHPDIDVKAITVVSGNVPLEQGVKNSLYFTELCEVDVPVYAGADRPLIREASPADWFHGADGLSDQGDQYVPRHTQVQESHAVDAIIELVRHTPDIAIITLGPLTNLAMAIRKAPDIVKNVSRFIVMGGAGCIHGNVTPAAEYNIWVDPEAARIVFLSGMPIEMIGWEFCQGEFVISPDEIEYIRAINTIYSDFTLDCNQTAIQGFETQTGEIGLSIPDAVAMSVAIDPTICTQKSQHFVDIECNSELTRGMTVIDKLNVTHDERNRDTWRDILESNVKSTICWELDAIRWKNMLYQLLR
jgi:inosine-uridine nucleoside N-ribohydrolase